MPRVETPWIGSARRSRRDGGARVSGTLANINVVPLIDVMLVLLVVFMVAAPLMQQAITVKLPESRRAPAAVTVPIRVTIPGTFQLDGRVRLNGEPMPLDTFEERLRQEIGGTPKRDVTVEADGTVTFNDWAQVYDRLLDVGVTGAHLLARPRD